MGLCLYLAPYVLYFAVFVDEVGDAMNAVVLTPHELLESPGTILLNHLGALVAEHRKWELVLVHEVRLLLWRICTHTNDLDVRIGQGVVVVSEVTPFGCTARCTRFGEEPEQYFLALEVLEAHG